MSRFWDSLFKLDYELSIWVEEEELGKKKAIYHKGKCYDVKIPQKINRKITLRLRGLGKTRFRKTGDLLLHVWLNKGGDVRKALWLSETSARNGAKKGLFTGEKSITMAIPKNSPDGLTIRLRGLGTGPSTGPCAPALEREKRGNLLVKLSVYPDRITPRYGSFEALSTEQLALEGWVYRKYDEVIRKLGKSPFPVDPIQACAIADLFNEAGWTSIFDALVDHLKLTNLTIGLSKSASISLPGSCERIAAVENNRLTGYNYRITIKEQFCDHPFFIAAILAHELCHVVYAERIDDTPRVVGNGFVMTSEKATLDAERTVDLLVFMFKMGEFQLRVARDKRLTLGYFDQEVFERIQVIVSRKLSSF
jgi:hypothetical protein